MRETSQRHRALREWGERVVGRMRDRNGKIKRPKVRSKTELKLFSGDVKLSEQMEYKGYKYGGVYLQVCTCRCVHAVVCVCVCNPKIRSRVLSS